jgi:hypothetical protein
MSVNDDDVQGLSAPDSKAGKLQRQCLRLVGELDWERIALTQQQVEDNNPPIIRKPDRRYKPVRYHDAVECEALSQAFIVGLVRARLDALLPEPRRARDRRQRRGRGGRALAGAATAGPGRLLPLRLHDIRQLLHAVARRAERRPQAAKRELSFRVDIIGLVLPAQRAVKVV